MPALQIKLFAILRERFDAESLAFESAASPLTAGELMNQLQERFPERAHLLALSRLAINRRFASPEDPVGPADELALIPPVSGG